MRKVWAVLAASVVLVLLLCVAVLSAPVVERNWKYCSEKGGVYLTKSWQCVSKDGIENMLWK